MKIERSILQSPAWAQLKKYYGWRPHKLGTFFVLERDLPFGQRFLYGPELTLGPRTDLRQFIHDGQKLARARQAIFLRLEFFEEWTTERAQELTRLGLVKSFEELQPEFRQWLDLRPPLTTILEQMKPKGRYNIRLAERHGVTVAVETDLDVFLRLFTETARRDNFAIRAAKYYQKLYQSLQKEGLAELLVARHNNQPLAAGIFVFNDQLTTYLYGASSSAQREVMAPFALHWKAIERAKERGSVIYDLLAVTPPQESQEIDLLVRREIQQLQKKYAGITRFKTQFGGRTVHLLGSWDLINQSMNYQLFKLAETWRRR